MTDRKINITQIVGEAGGHSQVNGIQLNLRYPYFKARPVSLSRCFDSIISQKAKDFVGRKFVLEELETFLEDDDTESGYFIISGVPGIGKSTLMAHIVRTYGYIHHFNIGLQNINKAHQFLESVCAQLIARYELKPTDLPPDPYSDGAFLNQLLHEASAKLKEKEKLVILVDALDEVERSTLPAGANILYLPQILPPYVYVVVTTREKDDIRLHAANSSGFSLLADSPENSRDVREYIGQKLSSEKMQQRMEFWKIPAEKFIDTLLQKSEGNFMYLYHILSAIKRGRISEKSLDQLPAGLLAYYRTHWRQMKSNAPEKFDVLYQPIVCILGAVKEAVAIEQVAAFTKISSIEVREVIKEWREYLYEELNEDRLYLYRVYHKSFQDFLREEVDPQLKAYHEMIARYYLELAGIE
ncbi:MAG: ATP-binding protein [bacterium]|nr:ATP-binding protein [bacterium]